MEGPIVATRFSAGERARVIQKLRHGSDEANVNPVHLKQARAERGLVIERTVRVTDLIERQHTSAALKSLRACLALPVWSTAFAALFLNGLVVPETDALLAIDKLRRFTGQSPLAATIVASFETLEKELTPVREASPQDMIYLAATWNDGPKLDLTFLSASIPARLIDRNRELEAKVASLRQYGGERFQASVTEAKKHQKNHLLRRLETYLAVLAWHHFNVANQVNGPASNGGMHTRAIATELNNLVRQAIGDDIAPESQTNGEDVARTKKNLTIGDKAQLIPSPDFIERLLKKRWKEFGLTVPDGRKGRGVKR